MSTTIEHPQVVSTAIVGAGFAGLGMAVRLLQSGVEDFVILERGDRVGGTWRDNTYPGAACDIPSLLYSYSFVQNPGWSRAYSAAPRSLRTSMTSSSDSICCGSSASGSRWRRWRSTSGRGPGRSAPRAATTS